MRARYLNMNILQLNKITVVGQKISFEIPHLPLATLKKEINYAKIDYNLPS